jgi:sialate O-acetylesterase
VLTDAGDSLNIHPTNKKVVGERLALWALAKNYGKKKLTYSGPLYKDMKVEKDKIRIRFDFAGSGLVAQGGELREFAIAGRDRLFVPAHAVIEGRAVVVYSDRVKEPVAVRFAWKNFPRPNLFNGAGLPASPFRTDDWEP